MSFDRVNVFVLQKHYDAACELGACDVKLIIGTRMDELPQWQIMWAESHFSTEMVAELVAATGFPIWVAAQEGSGALPGYGYGDSPPDPDGSGWSRNIAYGHSSRDGSGWGSGTDSGSLYGYGGQFIDGSGDASRPEDFKLADGDGDGDPRRRVRR